MTGLKNFLMFVYQNWTLICVCIGLVIGIYQKAKAFFDKSTNEQVAIAKKQIKEIMLKMVSEAEVDYDEWNKAGSIKRSQVIKKIFELYPVFSKAVDQQDVVNWIDHQIDSSLETLAEVIKANGDEVTVDGE